MTRIDVSAGLLTIAAAALLGCTLTGAQPDGADKSAVTDAYARGKANLAAGRLGLAVSDFQEALDQGGPTVERLNALAAAYDRLGRFDLADKHYREALAINPSAPDTMNNIGYSYFLRGRADLAAAFLARAKAAASEDQVILGNLALVTATVEQKGGLEPTPEPAPRLVSETAVASTQKPGRAAYIEQTGKSVFRLVTTLAEQPTEAIDTSSPASGDAALTTIPPVIEPMPAVTPAPVDAVIREPLPELSPAMDETQGDGGALQTALVEVSNGSGIEGSAARFRAFLREYGVFARRLTNDVTFGHRHTVLFYRGGFQDAAKAVASMLPTTVSLERNDAQYSDLRLRLGRDSERFDQSLASRTPTTTTVEQASVLGQPVASGIVGPSDFVPMPAMVPTPIPAAIREPLPEPTPASDPTVGEFHAQLQTTLFEVSNGSGINGSAARVRTYLQERGIIVGYLTNDAWRGHSRTVLFYRDGFRDTAMAIAARLPMNIALKRDDSQASDLRLRLGLDSEQFVKALVFGIQTAKL